MLKKIYLWLHKKTSLSRERGEYSAGYWQHQVRKLALDLTKKSSGRVLEIGCGEGLFLEQMMIQNPALEVYGLDLRSDLLEKAKSRLADLGKVDLRLADALNLPYSDNFFDTVVCVNVFFNLAGQAQFKQIFSQAARVCKKGGKIIFDIRNKRNLLLRLKYALAKYYDATVKNLPLTTYDPAEVKKMAIDAGFKLNAKSKINLFFGRFFPVIIIFEAQKC